MTARSSSRRRLATAITVALAVIPIAYAAQSAKGLTEMRFACADKADGALRYVARAGGCSSNERLIRFRQRVKPVITCARQGGNVYVVGKRRACRREPHAPSLVIILPDDERHSFCADRATGALRSIEHVPYVRRRPASGGSTCKSNEKRVFVKRANQRPQAADDAATVDEATAAIIDVLANDRDPEGRRLRIASVNARAIRGIVTVAADRRSLTYDPNGQFEALGVGASATETFRYRATDGRRRDRANVTVTVRGLNDAPNAAADAASTDENTATTLAVLANDSDPDHGDSLSVTAVDTTGTAGAVTINPDGTVHYDPAGRLDGLRPGETRIDRFAYTISDGHGGSASATASVSVTGVNDAPVVTTSGGDAAYIEGGPATAVDPGLVVTDADDANLARARVRIVSGHQAEDELLFTDTPDITGTFDAGTGVLTLSGTASVAEYQAALRSVTFDHTGANPASEKSVEFTANDGTADSAPAPRSITVSGEDDPPVAVDDSVTVGEDAAATAIGVLANDTDVDGGPKTIASASSPVNGTVTVTGGGTGLTYEPDGNYCNDPPGTSPDTFMYTLNGGSTAAVSVTVTCVDDAPTAVDDSATVDEDSPAGAIGVLANDTDIDGGPKTVESASDPGNGDVVITGGGAGLTYEPDANYCNTAPGGTPDTFTYEINGGSTATVSVTVTCVDDIPLAVDDDATVTEDTAANPLDVLANDTDGDGGLKVVASASDPANGTVALTGGTPGAHTGLTYDPDPNYCNSQSGGAPDTFTYTLNGGSTATVSVTVTCTDDTPTAVDDSATVDEDSPADAIDVLANDTDIDGGPKTIASVSDPTNGTVVLTGGAPGAHAGLTYEPDAHYCNTQAGGTPDTFTYTLNGGSTATVAVTVNCADDSPIAVNDSATVAEDSAAGAIDVLANDTDVDGGPKSIASAGDPANGTVVVTGGGSGLTYQPDTNYCNGGPGGAPDTFTYTLDGGSIATVSVTVTCSDDPPAAVDDSATVDEDTSAGAIDVLANDTDLDGGPMTIESASNPANGTVTITDGGTGLTYEPDGNYCNDPPGASPDTFTYTLNGGSTATVSVTVTCLDDSPLGVDDAVTVAEDSSASAIDVLANDTDVDGGSKSIASAGDPANGTVVVTGGGTGLTYEPDPDYCNDPIGMPDTFTYALNGGSSATVAVTVTCVNDAPRLDTSDTALNYPEGAGQVAVDAGITVTDPDSTQIQGATVQITSDFVAAQDQLAFVNQLGISHTYDDTTGLLTLSGDASVADYQAALRAVTYENGSDDPSSPARTLTFTTTDTEGAASTPATRDITLGASNDAATVDTTDTALAYAEGDPETAADPGLTVTDADDLNLEGATVRISAGAQGGDELLFTDTASITGSGSGTDTLELSGTASKAAYEAALRSVGYRHTGDDPETVKTIEFRADDGDGLGPASTRNIDITATDDPPVAVDDSATVAEDSAASAIDVLANDSDVDHGLRRISAASDPANGTVVLTGGAPGSHTGLTYQPDPDYCNDPPGTTPDTFTYTLNGGSTATVSVTVTCSDDPPTAVDDSATVDEDAAAGAIDVLANDTDSDGGPKTIASASDPANGAVVLTGGSPGAHTGLTYEPDPNYCNDPPGTSPDTFTYTINGGSTATVSVAITCVDDAPIAVNDGATVTEDSAATAVDVLANDTNPDGGPKTIASATDPANGTVVLTGGSPGAHTGLTYQPDADYCNDPPGTSPDTFTYSLDGGSTATVSVTVSCTPDDPVVDTSAASTSYTENAPATAIDSAVTVTDPDAGTTITGATVEITGGLATPEDVLALAGSHPGITPSLSDDGDTLTLTGDASPAAYQAALRDVTYRNTSEDPSDAARTVTFTVTDATARSGSDTKGVTVVAVDDPPAAVNDAATVLEDASAMSVPVLTNDTDVDDGPKTISSASDPANGTVVLTGGSPGAHTGLTYQPDPDYCNDPPGATPDTFTYTVNGGSTATASMTVTCVNDAPVADDETFNGNDSAHGNTAMIVNDPSDGAPDPSHPKTTVAGDMLEGDTDIDGPGPLTVTAETKATNDGGSVTIESDGDFTFHPAASTSCTDTSDFFDYTVEDSGSPEQTDTGRITIAIAGCVWYVSNNAAGNTGTSAAPFDTLAQAETASGANHTVFVFDGDDTSTGLDAGGYAMNAGERLIGEHEGLVVDPDSGGGLTADTLHAANAGAHPTLTANNADVIDLDDGNEVRGFNVDPSGTGGGIAGTAGDTGGGTIDDINIVDTIGAAGTQAGLELNATTGTFNITNLVVNNNATGVLLTSAGTTDFGSTTITSNGGAGLIATATNMSTSEFSAITSTNSANGGVNLDGTTGSTTLGDGSGTDLNLSTTSGSQSAFRLNNAGSVAVGSGGVDNIAATGGPAVDVTNTAGITLEFDDVDSTNSAGDGINIDGLGGGTFSATSGDIGGYAGIGLDLNGGNGAISYPGTFNNSAAATVAEITGRSGGTVTLSGAVADTNDAGGGISLSGNTGGSTTFSNPSKVLNTTTLPAVTFTGSDGHTLSLTGGGLDVDTTTGGGINATNSGTLTVSGAGNSVTTTTGTAVNVVNTDFGSATLQSISANGAANGVVLNNTGSTAGLTVTGGGSTAQGGDNSGGTIQNTTGHGISLTSTSGSSFRNMHLLNTGDSGVNGTQVSGFSFTDGRITGAGNASDENSITFDDSLGTTPNLTGAVTITNNVISQTEAEGIDVQNFAGTISDANISNNALSDTGDVATPGSAISLLGSGTPSSAANITRATIANNSITDFRAGAGIQVRGGNVNAGGPAGRAGTAGSATDVIAITGNTMNGGNGGVGNQPDRFFTGGAVGIGQGNFNVSNNGTAANRLRNIDCVAIEMQADGPVNFTSTVSSNFINANSAVGCAGIAVGTDDPLDMGAGTHTTLIQNNSVMGTDGPGIFPIVRDSGSTMTARVLNNTVAAPITTNAARAGIRVDSGSAAGDTTLCLEISGNTTAGSTNSGTATTSPGINLRKQGTDPNVNTFGIEGMAATASPGVESFVNSLNTSTSGTFGVGGTALLSAQSGFTSCTAP